MESDYDFLFKVLTIGDSGVGKTSTMVSYVDDWFNPEFQTTIGVDFKIKHENVRGKIVSLQLWDTAGQERFRHIVASYYRGAKGVILMYDITQPESFQNIKKWNEEASQYLHPSVPKLLIGNKMDLSHNRKVPREEAQEFADEHGLDFIETSAKNAHNIRNAFIMMTEKILDRFSDIQNSIGKNPGLGVRKKIKRAWCCYN